jgi:thiamine biosynthesis lipoprotein
MSFVKPNITNNNLHHFVHHAMATIFEILIEHKDKIYAEQSALAAFQEIDRLEEELSCFKANSEISKLNNLKVGESLKLSINTHECLLMAKRIYEISNGLFDITAGKIIDKWKYKSQQKSENEENKISKIGMDNIIINPETFETIKLSDEIKIDLGGLGKGYAIDIIAEQLSEWDIENALIHSGGSTVKSVGKLNGFEGWPISISNPNNTNQVIIEILLSDFSLSGSGKQKDNHIINPKSNLPDNSKTGAWALAESATISDAMSTTFMLMSQKEIEELCSKNDYISGMVIMTEKQNVAKEDLFLSSNFLFDKLFV